MSDLLAAILIVACGCAITVGICLVLLALLPRFFPTPVLAKHEPLNQRSDGTPILGLKRCAACGISETYWQRWPVCYRAENNKQKEEAIFV